jgi:site-specific DNA-methyltransferase (adenine-specific)
MGMTVELLNMDCMEYMRDQPNNAFDLAIVDPPYGIGMDGGEWNNTPTGKKSIQGKSKGLRVEKKGWDSEVPSPGYFQELRRVSKAQIIWGGNYFTEHLPPQRCWLCWDKKQPDGVKFSQFELAWTSLDSICKTFRMYPTHVAQGVKIHPTQKPTRLYQWILENYAERGISVLDTHLGSGSSAIAAHYFGCDFVGMELDEDYYAAACERFERETAQISMF